jgi:hypothetical protein
MYFFTIWALFGWIFSSDVNSVDIRSEGGNSTKAFGGLNVLVHIIDFADSGF